LTVCPASPVSASLVIDPFTQYEAEHGRSACGPTTMAAISEYWRTKKGKSLIQGLDTYQNKGNMIDRVYAGYGGKWYGMSVARLCQGLVHYVRDYGTYSASATRFNDFDTYQHHILQRRPVAVKFDQYSSFKWCKKYAFRYHWVIGFGYQVKHEGQHYQERPQFLLKVHDNGMSYKSGGYRESKVQYVDYAANREIMTMVGFTIH
jgi:hypothetical protein